MFDYFRNNMKFLMGFLMLLIIPSFVLFGIEGYSRFRESTDVVAKVGKLEISRQEWDAAHRREVDRLAASMPGLDRSLLETEEARLGTLERMVTERVLALAAQDAHMVASDQRLARELSQDPAIAALRRADGTLDAERYRELLRAQGMTPEMFEASVRADIARRQVSNGVAASGFVSTGAAEPALRAYFERREVQVALFQPRDFAASVQISDADVQRYYDENQAQFQAPELVDLEYVVLDLDAVSRSIRPSEDELRAYYEQNNASLALQEQRRASHILLTVDAGASAEQKAAVKARAQALLEELKKNPGRFAEVAKANSQDPGSAANGGDLDFFARGAMVKPFEDAVFALEKGQMSGVVETDFGYHIIQLTDVRRPAAQPYQAVRPKLEEDFKRQQAQRRFAEYAEDFSNLVYENSDSLAPAAQKLGLAVRKAEGVLRSGPATSGKDAVLSSPRLLSAVFAEDVLRQKANTEAVETGQNQLVSARVVAHRPAHTLPLDEVKTQVRDRLQQQRARELAVAEGKAKLQAWRDQPNGAALRAPVVISRTNVQGLPVAAVTAALSAPAGASVAAWTGVELGNEGYMVIRVNRVLDREAPSAEAAAQERSQLGQLWTQAESQAYLLALRAHYKVQVNPKKESSGAQ
ncbi:SurA N-terminal domain-containing protein [Hydrogenophaga aquatica]